MNPDKAIREIFDSKYLSAFTGAGVSTLSGIPDFRGKNGLYNRPDFADVFNLNRFKLDPTHFYETFKEMLYGTFSVESSLVHHSLAKLEERSILKFIITQNIDRLHQRAGSKKVIEIHGGPEFHTCLKCKKKYAFDEIAKRVQVAEIPPLCTCGGFIKPDITFFGEELPPKAFEEAEYEAMKSDIMLVLGTSLSVYPAALLPQVCLRSGGKLIIVNDQETPLDAEAFARFDSLFDFFTTLDAAF